MSDGFKPQLIRDGRFDPEALEQAGGMWVLRWLESRLSGRDPYVPLDGRVDEDPSALVVALLRELGLAHPASRLLWDAVAHLLRMARDSAPDVPSYFLPLLRICGLVRLPAVGPWFSEEIELLARDAEAREAYWGGGDRMIEIVLAALLQSPAVPDGPARAAWERLLEVPRYGSLALRALSSTIAGRAPLLATWWKHAPEDERRRALDQIIFVALRNDGEDTTLQSLRSAGGSMPTGLRQAINDVLHQHKAAPAFDVDNRSASHAYCTAWDNAGWRREYQPDLAGVPA